MNKEELVTIVGMIRGCWSSPPMDKAEMAQWGRYLQLHKFTPDEAVSIIDDFAESGITYRPRPGQFVAALRELRKLRPINAPALPSGDRFSTLEESRTHIEELKKMIKDGKVVKRVDDMLAWSR